MEEPVHSIIKNEALFKALVQNSTDIFILANKNFKLNYINDAVTKVLGYYPDELTGRSGFEIVHKDDKEGFAAWIAQLIENPFTIAPIEFRMKNSIGAWIYLEATGQNMLTNETVNAILINCKDVHAKKIADQAL